MMHDRLLTMPQLGFSIWFNFYPLNRKRGYMRAEAVIFDFDGTLVHLNIDFKLMRQEVERLLAEYTRNDRQCDDAYFRTGSAERPTIL